MLYLLTAEKKVLSERDVGRSESSCSIWPDSYSLWGSVCWQSLPVLRTVDDEMRRHLGSLSEALLDGHVGEGAWELLDDPHVYLWAERDVQEEKLRTRLEEFLQRGSTHQPCTCQLDKSAGMRRQCRRCAAQNTLDEQRNRAIYYSYDQIWKK